jgi:hypothetical protein
MLDLQSRLDHHIRKYGQADSSITERLDAFIASTTERFDEFARLDILHISDHPAGVSDNPAGDSNNPAGDADYPAGVSNNPAGDADSTPTISGVTDTDNDIRAPAAVTDEITDTATDADDDVRAPVAITRHAHPT